MKEDVISKKNVDLFNRDVVDNNMNYRYNNESLSSQTANKNLANAILSSYSFKGKKVLDMGSGDGYDSVLLATAGQGTIVGIEPAENAVKFANERSASLGLSDILKFYVGNVYTYKPEETFDCVVLRGVLHHLPDQAKAIKCASAWANEIIIIEPNGFNPLLKIIEKTSRYHIEHEEQSFTSWKLKKWLNRAGFSKIRICKFVNLIPLFCPDWMVKILMPIQPIIEKIPLLRELFCGCIILVAEQEKK